jgi:5-methylcytosine-specific restriction endonuclease McrA
MGSGAYYFLWWFFCTECRTVYMVEEAKRFWLLPSPKALSAKAQKKTRKKKSRPKKQDHPKRSQEGFWRAYEKYIRSEKWLSFRESIIAERGRKCEECPTTSGKLHLHHLHYGTFKHERPQDVKLLCVPCHQKKDPGKLIS